MYVKVVGPCASGKSVLTARLRELGFDAHSAAQDHSYVPDMWLRLNPPDVLIYLDVTVEAARQRGHVGAGWDQSYLDQQHERLRHARVHCDLYLPTDSLSEEGVLTHVVEFLRQLQGSPGLRYNELGIDGTSSAGRAVGRTAKEATMSEPRAIGSVIHYWSRLSVAGVDLSDSLRTDDWVYFRGATTDFQQRVTSMQLNHRFINEAHAGQQIGVLVAEKVRVGDTVYLLED